MRRNNLPVTTCEGSQIMSTISSQSEGGNNNSGKDGGDAVIRAINLTKIFPANKRTALTPCYCDLVASRGRGLIVYENPEHGFSKNIGIVVDRLLHKGRGV